MKFLISDAGVTPVFSRAAQSECPENEGCFKYGIDPSDLARNRLGILDLLDCRTIGYGGDSSDPQFSFQIWRRNSRSACQSSKNGFAGR